MFAHSAFGISLRSNLRLPGVPLDSVRDPDAPHVSFTLGAMPDGVSSASGQAVYTTDGLSLCDVGGYMLFAYADLTRVAVRKDGGAVWATWPPELTLDDTAAYLLGPVMAFVLMLRGRLSLHAAVFATPLGAMAVAGGPEAGKSTLLAALALRGVRVMSDDLAGLIEAAGRFLIAPSYPRVRLWDDSVAELFGDRAALPLLTPNWEKRYLDVAERGLFEDRALPLRGIFVLAPRAAADAPRVEPLSPRDAVLEVLAHLHSVWMLPRRPQREIFALASRLVARTPVVRLVPHRDAARLPELCDLVLATASDGLARAHLEKTSDVLAL